MSAKSGLLLTPTEDLNHANIIRYCNRPFSSVGEMNAALVRNWNSAVSPKDTVYHLGDFGFFKSPEEFFSAYSSLHGTKILLRGNHDKGVPKIHIQGDLLSLHIQGIDIYMCHYAMRVWNRSHYGSWCLYGHSHGTLPELLGSMSCDVGVDCWNYTPVSLDQLIQYMDRKKQLMLKMWIEPNLIKQERR